MRNNFSIWLRNVAEWVKTALEEELDLIPFIAACQALYSAEPSLTTSLLLSTTAALYTCTGALTFRQRSHEREVLNVLEIRPPRPLPMALLNQPINNAPNPQVMQMMVTIGLRAFGNTYRPQTVNLVYGFGALLDRMPNRAMLRREIQATFGQHPTHQVMAFFSSINFIYTHFNRFTREDYQDILRLLAQLQATLDRMADDRSLPMLEQKTNAPDNNAMKLKKAGIDIKNVPEDFICKITGTILTDPIKILTGNGNGYINVERNAMKARIQAHNNHNNNSTNREQLTLANIQSNHELKKTIDAYVVEQLTKVEEKTHELGDEKIFALEEKKEEKISEWSCPRLRSD